MLCKIQNCKKSGELSKVYMERLKKAELEEKGNFITVEVETECNDFEGRPVEVNVKLTTCLSCNARSMRGCPKCGELAVENFCAKCGGGTVESCIAFKKLEALLEDNREIFEDLKFGPVSVKKVDLNLVCPNYIKR